MSPLQREVEAMLLVLGDAYAESAVRDSRTWYGDHVAVCRALDLAERRRDRLDERRLAAQWRAWRGEAT